MKRAGPVKALLFLGIMVHSIYGRSGPLSQSLKTTSEAFKAKATIVSVGFDVAPALSCLIYLD